MLSNTLELLKPCFPIFIDKTFENSYVVSENDFLDGLQRAKDQGLCRPLVLVSEKAGVLGAFRFKGSKEVFFIFVQSHAPLSLERKIRVWNFDLGGSDSIERSRNARPVISTLNLMPPDVAVKWIAKASPDNSVALQWALAQAFEKYWDVTSPDMAQRARSFFVEFQRIEWSIKYCIRLYRSFGLEPAELLGAVEYLREIKETFSISRTYIDICCVGGVVRNLKYGHIMRLKSWLGHLEQSLREYFDRPIPFGTKKTFTQRTASLNKDWFESNSWGGAIGQAAGFVWDFRETEKLYPEVVAKSLSTFRPLKDSAEEGIGIADRFASVKHQLMQSFTISKALLYEMDDSKIRPELPERNYETVRRSFCAIEGADGPVFVLIDQGKIGFTTNSIRNDYIEPHLIAQEHKKQRAFFKPSLGMISEERGLVDV